MEANTSPLNLLPLGHKAVIEGLTAEGTNRRRMLELGLIQGSSVEALHRSPSGDPTAYSIMGAVIALRNEDAEKILINSIQ